MTVHPAARILLWCGWAVGVESVSLKPLLFLAVVSATAFVCARVRRAAWRLLKRARWLMLVLILSYAYTLPGDALWPAWASFSPTQQGLSAGALRALRLALMMIGLALLLVYTPRERLIYGLYVLLAPLSWLGFERRAFAVRLGLTLDYIERQPRADSLAQWLDKLKNPVSYPGDDTAVFRLQAERWTWRDSLCIGAAVIAVGASVL